MWKIAEAKKRFSELIRRSQGEPQLVYRRDELVAVVVSPEDYERFAAQESRESESVESLISEVREAASEGGYELLVPKRKNRRSPRLG